MQSTNGTLILSRVRDILVYPLPTRSIDDYWFVEDGLWLLRRIGFVSQDDILFPHLTVKETLVYAAMLRLPNSICTDSKIRRAEEIIFELGLDRWKTSWSVLVTPPSNALSCIGLTSQRNQILDLEEDLRPFTPINRRWYPFLIPCGTADDCRCSDTIIGGPFLKGVSRGERKRVCVGHEIIIDPSMLFLDEPTSGLDSAIAVRLVQVLQNIAEVRELFC